MDNLLLFAVEQLTYEVGGVAGVAVLVTSALLFQHRRAIKRIWSSAPPLQVVVLMPPVPVPAPVAVAPVSPPKVVPKLLSAPVPLPALSSPPPMPEADVCALCCEAVAATRRHVHCHSVRYTPDQVRKAAVQMARRMAKGPLPADIEARIRKELAGPAAILEADHG